MTNKETRIVIIGGGFGGVQAALRLARKRLPGVRIVLLSDRDRFEYHGVLYRVAAGRTPMEVCIPMRDIFEGTDVDMVTDRVAEIDTAGRHVLGESGSRYAYDFLVLALGSETTYFDIPGLREFSFGVKSAEEAIRLKRHIHETFAACDRSDPEDRSCSAHIIIVGGGASGVEVAGELAVYARDVAEKHGLGADAVTIDLIEAAPRILPMFPESFVQKIADRLRALGVNVMTSQAVTEQEVEEIHLKDMEMRTKTVVWTAGAKPHHLYGTLPGIERDRSGRVVVDDRLSAKNLSHVFVIGDAAATPHAGMAQTAIRDGLFVADVIADTVTRGSSSRTYRPKKSVAVLPIGSGWAAARIGDVEFSGRPGWWFRRFFDFLVYQLFLPFPKAWRAFRESGAPCESCDVCSGGTGKPEVMR